MPEPIRPQTGAATSQGAKSGQASSDAAERRLLGRVAEGDREAFAALYRRYHRPLFGYLLRVTGRLELTEELVDDVLLVVWRKAATFEGRSRVSSWVFGIAYRKALKRLERRDRRPEDTPLADAPPAVERHTPEQSWDRRERAAAVAEALSTLPSEQRSVVVLTYYHGLSYPEIAEVLDCPVGTVKSRMFHARRKLAARLPELGFGAAATEEDER